MSSLLPHFKSRVPSYLIDSNGGSLDSTNIPHAYGGNFPTDRVVATNNGTSAAPDWDNTGLVPDGGVDNPTVVVVATGASDAGVYTPSGATAPADLSAASSLVASPNTAWTSGQSIVLGDGSSAHWDGSAWAVGSA